MGRNGRSIAVAVGTVALLVAGAFGYVATVRRQTQVAVLAALTQRQAQSVEQFDAWLDERTHQAREWADRPDTRALVARLLALDEPTPSQLNSLAEQVEFRKVFSTALGREGLQGYFIVSPQGRSLGSLGTDNTGTTNLLWNEPEFFAQMRTRGAALSPLMPSDVLLQNGGISLDGKSLTLFVGVPIFLGDAEPAAYFTIRVPPISLLAVQGRARFGESGISHLVDRLGRLHADRSWLNLDLAAHGVTSEAFRGRRYVFARDPGANVLVTPPHAEDRGRLPLTLSTRSVQQGDGSSLTPYRDHRGIEVVGMWTWDAKLGLAIVTEMPVREAYAPIVDALQRVVILLLLFAALAIGALVLGLVRSRRQLHAALIDAESASRAKGVFLANMSHEIRTPMNAIIGLTHLLSRDAVDHLQRDRLGKIGGAARHLLQVINDVLDLSKIEAGKLELADVDFSLDEITSRAFELVSERARDRGLELVLDMDHLPGRFRGDPMRLSQMLINLLSNAVKFTARGWVRLRGKLLSEEADHLYVRFEVQDTGEGIPLERQRELFVAFAQADSAATRRFGGTGLGLALTRQFALAMRGEIGVDSVVGQGSTFWFTARLGRGTQPGERPRPIAMKGLRALLIDDLPEALLAIEQILKLLGFDVDAHTDPLAAIDKVAAEATGGGRYDVMLIDWRMEPLDGIETMRRLRMLLGAATPPSIMVTAADDPGLRNLAAAVRFDDVLLKPITSSAMHDALSRVLQRQHPANLSKVPAAAGAEAILIRDHAGQRVLLAEDNPVNREVAQELLRAAGLVVENVEDGAQAIEQALARHYDLILMDMQMPLIDGLQATRAIRIRKGGALPIIAMTANAFDEERKACIDAGMNDHVAKPVDPAVLYAALLKWLPLPVAPASSSAADAGASEETVSIEDRLAGIEGFDMASGLRNVGGQTSLLLRALRLFVETYRAGEPDLLDSTAPDHAKRWQAICHSVRGASATIGAIALTRLADELADCIAADPDSPATRSAARTLHEALQQFAGRFMKELAA